MSRKICVIGSNGYVGQNLVSLLSSQGFDVIGLGRNEVDLSQKVKTSVLRTYVDSSTTVVMCAAITRTSGDTPETCLQNIQMLHHLLGAIQEIVPAKFIYMSAADVYGVHGVKLSEDKARNPLTPYGSFKTYAEHILPQCLDQIPLVTLRFPGVFGGTDTKSIVARFSDRIIANEPLTLSNKGETIRDYVSVYLLADAIAHIVDNEISGSFNLTCAGSTSMRDLVNLLGKKLSRTPDLTLMDEANPRDFNLTLDCSAFSATFHNLSQYRLSTQIEKFLAEK